PAVARLSASGLRSSALEAVASSTMTTTPAPTLPDEALERLRRQDAAAPAPGTTLTIAEVAERTGVSAHSLRYYERIGLLDVPRDPAGNRVYDERAYARVVFCSRLRSEEHTSELQSRENLVCRLLLENHKCYEVCSSYTT